MSEPEVKYGIFKTEIKNRFLCTVNVDGIDTLCYIPSSCRLSNFINMKGRMVLLLPIKKENARTKYSVYAIQYRRGFVPVSLSSVNQVIKTSLIEEFSLSWVAENKFLVKKALMVIRAIFI